MGGNHEYKKRQDIEASVVMYQKHLLCVRHSVQSLGFTVDRTVEATVLTELTINIGTKE